MLNEQRYELIVFLIACATCAAMFAAYVLFGHRIFHWLGITAFFVLVLSQGEILVAGHFTKLADLRLLNSYTLKERIAFVYVLWLGLGIMLYSGDPIFAGTHIAGHVGVFEVTTGYIRGFALLLMLAAFLIGIPARSRANKKYAKKQRAKLMESSGEVINWGGGKGKVRIYSPTFSKVARRLGSRTMKATSRFPLAVGDRIKVIDVDEKLKVLEVNRQDTGTEANNNPVGAVNETIKLSIWLAAAFAIWLLSVSISSDYFSSSFFLVAVITALMGLLTSSPLRGMWSPKVLSNLTWKRQLAIWLIITLVILLIKMSIYFFYSLLSEIVVGLENFGNQ